MEDLVFDEGVCLGSAGVGGLGLVVECFGEGFGEVGEELLWGLSRRRMGRRKGMLGMLCVWFS